MARLVHGENEKIDMINDLVHKIIHTNDSESMEKLLQLFHPLILSICTKWSIYFRDEYHEMKPFSEIVSEAESWFAQYTITKYIEDGRATYNKFIKDHVDQRVRYIYECELKYYKNNLFPDPDKHDEDSDIDSYEYVVYKYKTDHNNNTENEAIDNVCGDSRVKLAHKILSMLNDSTLFNPREVEIFTEIAYNGVTHEEMGNRLGISRTRVSQILQKIKNKLYKLIETDQESWELINDADINYEER